MEFNQELDKKPRKEMGPIMFLSLFLLLLAFFILLNSISSLRETKSRAVLTSVASTFQAETTSDTSPEILISTLGPVPEPEQVLDEVERLWLTAVPITKVERLTSGNAMMVEVPTTQLFVGAEPGVRGDRDDLIASTASALSARIPGQITELRAIIFVDDLGADIPPLEAAEPVPGQAVLDGLKADGTVDLDNPDAALTLPSALEGKALAIARQEVFAEALVEYGAPPGNIQVGLMTGRAGWVRMRFLIRDAETARLTFSDLVPGIAQ